MDHPLTGEVIREGLTLQSRDATRFSRRSWGQWRGSGTSVNPTPGSGRFMRWLGFDCSLDIGYPAGQLHLRQPRRLVSQISGSNWGRAWSGKELGAPGGNVTEERHQSTSRKSFAIAAGRSLGGAFEALEEFLPDDFRDLSFPQPGRGDRSLRRVASRPHCVDTIQAFYARVQADPYAFMRSDRHRPCEIPFLSHLDIVSPEEQIQRH